MSKKYLSLFLIFILIIGITYYILTPKPTEEKEKYWFEKNHWKGIMNAIVSPSTKLRLLSHFSSEEQSFYNGQFMIILIYLRTYLKYTTGDIPLRKTLYIEDPEYIIWNSGLGRCGEFSIAYTALLLTFNIEARLIVHLGADHMWTEVWLNNSWIHVDPTENIVDRPSLYAIDWKKQVDSEYPVFAFMANGTIADITERYASRVD